MNETRKKIIELIEPYFAEWQTDYDITAVIKYVKDKWWFISANYKPCLAELDIIYIEIWKWIWEYQIKWYFPPKPLYLYTEQEEKKLLQILLSLK